MNFKVTLLCFAAANGANKIINKPRQNVTRNVILWWLSLVRPGSQRPFIALFRINFNVLAFGIQFAFL